MSCRAFVRLKRVSVPAEHGQQRDKRQGDNDSAAHAVDLRRHGDILAHSTGFRYALELQKPITAQAEKLVRAKDFPLRKTHFCYGDRMTFLYILLGLVVGVLSGIVGIGGGIMIIPALVYFFHMSQHKAQGTSLAALLLPIGALAFWEYYKAGNVDLKAGLLIAFGFLIGGYFGGLWAQHLPEVVLRRVFGTLLAIIGIQLLLSRG